MPTRRITNVLDLPNDTDALAELRTELADTLLHGLPLTVAQAIQGVEAATAGWQAVRWPVVLPDGRTGYRLVVHLPARD